MNYRPRPGGSSLPPAEHPAFRGLGPVDLQEPARFSADVMLTGSGWHRPAGAERPRSPSVGLASGAPGGPRDLVDPPAPASASERARSELARSELARSELAAAFAAGFTHHSERDRARRDFDRRDGSLAGGFAAGGFAAGGSPPGGFAAGGSPPGGFAAGGFTPGGVLDQMLPGGDLAAHLAAARRAGYGQLTDTQTCGVIAACRRLASWAAEGELTAIASLAARRATPSGRPGDHTDAEIGALLRLTPRRAAELTGLARDFARLPQTRALLAAGIIDRDRAKKIIEGLSVLDDDDAALVEDNVTREAGEQTTGQLQRRVDTAVKAHDPQAAARRKEKALKDARVEVWAEAGGTAALAGRDLPPAGVIEGDKSLDADARWLKAHGAPGSHDKRRADAFLARLTGRPLISLIPTAPAPAATAARGGAGASATTPGATTGGGTGPAPGSTGNGAGSASSTGSGVGSTSCTGPGPGSTATGPGSTRPEIGDTDPGPDQTGPRLGGTVHLTMPATTWLGLTHTPGDIPGIGPTDATTSRDLADTLAANPATKWCITLTDAKGRAVAHGCARAGPGPPATTGTTHSTGRTSTTGTTQSTGTTHAATSTDRRSWLANVTITPIATGTCDHRHQSAGYQPSDRLRHLVKTRSPRCGYPGCRRPATRCDDDHTVAHHLGGRTCECNLHPLCRYHHQVKQAPGWHLDQPEPGVLVWTTPSGRTYTTTAEPYRE
jgi:hypothetical protein